MIAGKGAKEEDGREVPRLGLRFRDFAGVPASAGLSDRKIGCRRMIKRHHAERDEYSRDRVGMGRGAVAAVRPFVVGQIRANVVHGGAARRDTDAKMNGTAQKHAAGVTVFRGRAGVGPRVAGLRDFLFSFASRQAFFGKGVSGLVSIRPEGPADRPAKGFALVRRPRLQSPFSSHLRPEGPMVRLKRQAWRERGTVGPLGRGRFVAASCSRASPFAG